MYNAAGLMLHVIPYAEVSGNNLALTGVSKFLIKSDPSEL
jgi:hypothetical protein